MLLYFSVYNKIVQMYTRHYSTVCKLQIDFTLRELRLLISDHVTCVPYLVLPYLWGWAGCYTCPVLRPYQFGPVRFSKCYGKRL